MADVLFIRRDVIAKLCCAPNQNSRNRRISRISYEVTPVDPPVIAEIRIDGRGASMS